MTLRLEWAILHLDWTLDDWFRILWSVEAYIDDEQTTSLHAIRKRTRQPILLVNTGKTTRGCFGALSLGAWQAPLFFGEKIKWGNMKAQSYCQQILLEVVDFLSFNPSSAQHSSEFMHDNAPTHIATVSKHYLRNHRINTMEWPPYSPDLNSIDNVWSDMKAYLFSRYGGTDGGRQRCRNEIHPLVQEA